MSWLRFFFWTVTRKPQYLHHWTMNSLSNDHPAAAVSTESISKCDRNLRKQQERTQMQDTSSSRSPAASLKAARTARSPLPQSLPQSAFSPHGMPVITEVISLSPCTSRKRSLDLMENHVFKQARAFNEDCKNTPDNPSTSTVISDELTSQMEIPDSHDSADDDDDVKTKNMPEPQLPTFNFNKVRLESRTCNDVQDSDHISIETPASEWSRTATMDPSISDDHVSMTTQTECGTAVKVEEDQQRRKEVVEMQKEEIKTAATGMEQHSTEVESRKDKDFKMNRLIKDCMDIDSKPSLAKEKSLMYEKPDSIKSLLNIDHIPTLEAQKHQDSLVHLLEVTVQERDEYKMKAQSLTLELEKKELKLLDLIVKKEFSHQSIQTDPEEKDYKTLYLEATQHIKQLIQTINELKEKEEILLQMKTERESETRMNVEGEGHSPTTDEEDEMAVRVKKCKGVILPDVALNHVSLDYEKKLYQDSARPNGKARVDRFATLLFKRLIPLKVYQKWTCYVNYDGSRGKNALPNNLRQTLSDAVTRQFHPTAKDWKLLRDRINELLRKRRIAFPLF